MEDRVEILSDTEPWGCRVRRPGTPWSHVTPGTVVGGGTVGGHRCDTDGRGRTRSIRARTSRGGPRAPRATPTPLSCGTATLASPSTATFEASTGASPTRGGGRASTSTGPSTSSQAASTVSRPAGSGTSSDVPSASLGTVDTGSRPQPTFPTRPRISPSRSSFDPGLLG